MTEKGYRLTIAVLGILVIALAAVAVWQIQGKDSADEEVDEYAAGPEAQAEAERILGEMVSYDYREIDDEYEWTMYLSNDELRSDYEDRIVPRLAKVIKQTKAAAEGEIVESAYDVESDTKVTVLAFIRQTLTNAENAEGVIDEQWASLTMAREDEDADWLIEKIDIVSVPPPS